MTVSSTARREVGAGLQQMIRLWSSALGTTAVVDDQLAAALLSLLASAGKAIDAAAAAEAQVLSAAARGRGADSSAAGPHFSCGALLLNPTVHG